MSKLGEVVCPFYKHEKTSNGLKCELAVFHFPDAESKEQIKAYCCDFCKYKQCTLYQVLNDYWERKYKETTEVMP